MPWYLELKKMKFSNPLTTIKVVLIVHYLLTVMGAIGTVNPFVYLFYNFVVIFLLIWSLYSKSDEPLKLAILINMCAIILDALYIVAMADILGSYRAALSLTASVIHLIFRPFSILILIKKDEKITALNNDARNNRTAEIDDRSVPSTIS
ncbi:unnamed protein product [Psylliodes chrysocephalus]|uniref:Uncharacterized protein n=1 Tax=Psylliodes chrysocephalus TaxID=3402493 RepID=A0A9P0CWM7_9CUCU|nr:unnamed protein product [Psylliodes chrysocephala]